MSLIRTAISVVSQVENSLSDGIAVSRQVTKSTKESASRGRTLSQVVSMLQEMPQCVCLSVWHWFGLQAQHRMLFHIFTINWARSACSQTHSDTIKHIACCFFKGQDYIVNFVTWIAQKLILEMRASLGVWQFVFYSKWKTKSSFYTSAADICKKNECKQNIMLKNNILSSNTMTPCSKHRLQLKDGNRCPDPPFSHQQRADPLVNKGSLTAEKYTGNHRSFGLWPQ